jgi:hypothetical protein
MAVPDPAASGSARYPTTRPTACIPSSLKTSQRGRLPRPTDGLLTPGAPGVRHDPRVIGKIAAHVVLPWVHRIFSNLKVWALGVYHGLRRRHLQSYLDEFVFRFNRRRTRHAAFRSLLGSPQTTHLLPTKC